MEKLKQIALKESDFSADHEASKSAVDAIASYGIRAVPTLIEIGDRGSIHVRQEALKWVAKIKTEARARAEVKKAFGP